ncbi:DUF4468 domain-containing protein [Polaribacter sp. MSW13]|uniref:DUF4468 domain-containing protein n=1 Tax=Polaribacter marinus TaxID=2916838 RepID=A0A9X1VR32_9FLAO|nr:DUF4468 domain-containing protein [Polaribacter marinus]MCI2230288.1 DUF4468 domain-containing protein [Polaribacter marinus]
MKKHNIILFLSLLLTTFFSSYSQEFEIKEKKVIGIFEIKNKNKSELYSNINKWISINYTSSKDVIQMNDKESGTIIIKGINKVNYTNKITTKGVFKSIQEHLVKVNRFNHLIEINIKDNKFRIIYALLKVNNKDYGWNKIVFDCISLNGINEVELEKFNLINDAILKKGMINKKKREKFNSLSKPFLNEMNNTILENIKNTMNSLKNSIKITGSKDDW